MLVIRRTAELSGPELAEIRALCDAAFAGGVDGGFHEHDWAHSLGGHHVLRFEGDRLVGQAAVVPRILRTGEKPWCTGYVEAVAVSPDRHGRGFGGELMGAVNTVVREHYELGGLCAGERAGRLYQRHGWLRWRGHTFVDGPGGTVATPEEDGAVYVLPSTDIDLGQPIVCDWREGDVW